MPEEVDGALLAAVPAGELLEHARRSSRGRARSARPRRRRRSRARGRPGTASSRGTPNGFSRIGHVELAEHRVQLLVEVGDGEAVDELERLRFALAVSTTSSVVDEVEADLEAGAVRPSAAAASSARARRRRAARATSGSSAAAEAIFTLPTICTQRCSVSFVGSHSASGSGGSGSISRPRTRPRRRSTSSSPRPARRSGRSGGRPRARAGTRGGSATSRSSRSSRRSCTCAGAPSGRRSSGTPRSRRSSRAVR